MRFMIRMSNGDRRLKELKSGRAMFPLKAAQVDPGLITFLGGFSRAYNFV